jgi:hypothetical protein
MPAPKPLLEQIDLHVWQPGGLAFDLSAARATPRRDVGEPLLDVGLLVREADGVASARSVRIAARATIGVALRDKTIDGSLGSPPQATVQIALAPLYKRIGARGGLVVGRGSGVLEGFGQPLRFEDTYLLWMERRGTRRPYAWARALLRGHIDGLPIVCLVETARRRAGSVVLPELGRLSVFGPGARGLPPACVIAPLPLRAEYGTGRLRASALGPGVRATVTLESEPSSTAVFEVVDPSGEAAYAHRALGARATLKVRGRRGAETTIELDGRYEWGARAGDPRVPIRAWRD